MKAMTAIRDRGERCRNRSDSCSNYEATVKVACMPSTHVEKPLNNTNGKVRRMIVGSIGQLVHIQ